MMLKFSRRVIFSTSSYFTLILLLICIQIYMTIRIYLLKHIFNLIKNRDRKCISDIYMRRYMTEKVLLKQAELFTIYSEHIVSVFESMYQS